MPVERTRKGLGSVYHNPVALAAHSSLVQATDFLAALKSVSEMADQKITHKQPRELIETMRIVGADLLTASDAALYELLLANAKKAGIDRKEHTIRVSHVQAFLSVRHLGRIVASLKRLTETRVQYDIRSETTRYREPIPLIFAEVTDPPTSGAASLTYAIPERIRRAVLASSEYALVDVAPLAAFKGKYTARIFQRLCIRAGYDDYFNSDWIITPKDLATEIGYPHPHRTNDFMTRVVMPGLKEINAHSRRFQVSLDEPQTKNTRGRAIKALVFHIHPEQQDGVRRKRVRLSSDELRFIKRADGRHDPAELPSVETVSMIMAMYPRNRKIINAFTLTDGWRCLLDRAKDNPDGIVFGNMTGTQLLKAIENGCEEKFEAYAAALQFGREKIAYREHQRVDRRPTSEVDIARLGNDKSVAGRRSHRWAKMRNEASDAQEMLDGWLPGSSSRRVWKREELAMWLDGCVFRKNGTVVSLNRGQWFH